VKSTVETLSPTRVRLSVEVPFAELKPSLEQAYKAIAQQITIPGFRRGKVPPRLIDQRVGRAAVLEETLNDAIPTHYSSAVREHEVKVLGSPEVEVTELSDGEKVLFTAEVDVRPEIALPDFSSVSAVVDEIVVADADVEESIDNLRERFAVLKTVERAAQEGDFVVLDLAATVDGEEVPGGTASGLSYEIGSGQLLQGTDEAVVGLSAGESATFRTELAGGEFAGREAEVVVTVKTVKDKNLPALDNEFAQTASEFDTLEELRADMRTRLERAKRGDQAAQARDKALEALLAAVEVPLPEKLVADELEYRKHQLTHYVERAGLTMDLYLQSEGKSAEEFDSKLEEDTRDAVKAQLVLDTVADAEELGVTDEELTQEVVRRAQQAGVAPQAYADQVVEGNQLGPLVADVRRGKALAFVLERASLTDSAGKPVDLDLLRS
jgi:trigger factor